MCNFEGSWWFFREQGLFFPAGLGRFSAMLARGGAPPGSPMPRTVGGDCRDARRGSVGRRRSALVVGTGVRTAHARAGSNSRSELGKSVETSSCKWECKLVCVSDVCGLFVKCLWFCASACGLD